MEFQIKRIYEAPAPGDGKRVLVDRLWPRGVSKARAHLDAWMKDVSPSPSLREWFGHKAENMPEFTRRYDEELRTQPEKQAAVQQLRDMAKEEPVTLLYAARDPQINHALVLQRFLQSKH